MIDTGRLLVLYGSQTFTAQEAAERIWRTSKVLGFHGPVQAMDDYPISRLIQEEYAIFVCSTTGQGDEPDNMKRFWKFLLRKSLPCNSLVKLKFGVLAFGDSSYNKFNFVGKKLHKRLLQLGATPLVDIGLCDYQHDLGHDAVMQPWLKEYFSCLKIYFPNIQPDELKANFIPRWTVSLLKIATPSENNNLDKLLSRDIYFGNHIKDDYFNARVLEVENNVRTTEKSHFQDVRLISFKTSDDTTLSYKPGDVFNIRPRNSREDIEDLFGIFKQHNLDIKPHYKLLVEEYHHGPERAAVIGGFSGGANTQSSQDDEYRYAGVEDPKVMITTSREPSARLKMFVKELRLIFPNSQRMNRGGYEMSQLIHACRANEVTDFIIVHEHRGVPDSLVICHLPYGPTAQFTLSGVVMRHDIPDLGPMSEQFPHLIFHNFKSELGLRTMSILKYLFPVPKPDSKRVITFANHDDYICFRQHTYRKPLTMYEISEQYWDLRCYPTQYVFSLLALVSEDKLERDKCIELSSPEGQEDWLNYCRRPRRTVLEVLHDFHKSTSKLRIEVLFELFSTIKPRSFSIASSPAPSGHSLDLLVAVVHYVGKLKKPRVGLASTWLKGLRSGDRVYGWIKNGTFHFPDDESTPHIMVGPGTGLAPFRSLLQSRVAAGTADREDMHLFFGCRYRSKDFHCRDELERWERDGCLSLYCAFSRDQDSKIYVQHKISENKTLLYNLITNKNGHIFISGNAKNMPDNVRDAFVEDVLCKVGGMDVGRARTMLKDLEGRGRLQVETW